MTPRETFTLALEGKRPAGRVPHFELSFALTMEAFGRVHPVQRVYSQWYQMSDAERHLHRHEVADIYVTIARRYEHSAIVFVPPGGWTRDVEEFNRTLGHIRDISGMDYFLLLPGDPTYAMPEGDRMMDFVNHIVDDPQKLKDDAQRKVDEDLEKALVYKAHGFLDGFLLNSDYCYNKGPFLSPTMFDEFVTPYLTALIAGYRELGFYTIKHTDGNIMPILDSLVSANPHALHSLDPQGGVDIAEVKRLVGDKVCLIGNVDCSLMCMGTDEDIVNSCRYALRHGMPGGGYVFSTSNSVYPGMNLRRYELMLDIWRKEGNYPGVDSVKYPAVAIEGQEKRTKPAFPAVP